MDQDAIEPKAASKGADADDDADGLAAMFGSLGVTNTTRRCQVCQTQYAVGYLTRFRADVCPGCLCPLRVHTAPTALFSQTRPAVSHWRDLPTFLRILPK